jgi:hypothetical protein
VSRRASGALTALVASCLVAALPAVAQAKRVKFGSNLSAPANRIEAHGADSVFWNTGLASKDKQRVPARGRVMTIRVKGTAIKHGGSNPLTLVHFQILHPSHGHVTVALTSGNFHVPVGGNPNRVTTYHPVNLCASKRDYVAFNDLGGFNPPSYPNGTPFQVFSSVAGSTTNFYSNAGGTNNGATFKGAPHKGEELLMQATVGTGKDAGICPH